MTVRVLLADDHPLFLDGLRLLLDSAGLEVVGAATTGEELLDLAATCQAEVAVVDVTMPGMGGIVAAGELARAHPGLAVLMLTMHDDPATVSHALHAGARGYVLKGAGHGAIVGAVRAVAEGHLVLGGEVREAALGGPGSRGHRVLPGLTSREREVLELVAEGMGNATIAATLHLSLKTVQNYVSHLLAKLGADSRAQVVAMARDAGIGTGQR